MMSLNNSIDLDAPESFFLTKLFKELNNKNIRYAVMRNHEPLPYSSGGSDLDILVATADAIRFQAVILSVISSAGGTPIGMAKSIGFFKLYVFGRSPSHLNRWWGIRLDINIGLYFKGHSILVEPAYWPTQSYRSIPVLSDGFAGILGVLKEVLNNGLFPTRYARAAQQGVKNNWSESKALIAPMGSRATRQLQEIILSSHSNNVQASDCSMIRNMFIRHTMWPHIGKYLWGRIAYEGSKLKRYLKPSGKVIAILGTDGAGKSTIINAIKPVLDDATHNATIIKHLRPNLLPPLARLKGITKQENIERVDDPHGSSPSGLLVSLFRLSYLTLDYIFGYWLKTRPAIAKQPTVIIFDRYAYDMELDPRRFRIKLPPKLIRIFNLLVPKPDLIICLYGEPEKIALRKQELPLEEVTRQTRELINFAKREPRAILISTDGTIDQTRDTVLSELQKYCKNKGRRCAK